MVMSTQISAEAARLLEQNVLTDRVQLLDVDAEPTTFGFQVGRGTSPVGDPLPALVQTTVLANAVESQVDSTYSVKVPAQTVIRSGQAVRVISCVLEPALVGKVLLLDKVSQNGAALIRKAVATDFKSVNQEGKGGLV